jgi:hypothetical protein
VQALKAGNSHGPEAAVAVAVKITVGGGCGYG